MNETVRFEPGEDKRPVTVVIVDDAKKPLFENKEVFDLTLSNPDKSTITMPEKAKIVIDDTEQDKDSPRDSKNLPKGKMPCVRFMTTVAMTFSTLFSSSGSFF